MKLSSRTVLAALAALAMHCGSSTPVTSPGDAGNSASLTCSGTVGGTNACWDISGPGDLTVPGSALCTSPYAAARVGSCSRTGIVGGCRTVLSGITTTNWIYGGTAQQVMMACTTAGSTYVTP